MTETPRVVFLMAYAAPTLGMERAALRLVRRLADQMDVRLVLMRGEVPQVDGIPTTVLLPPGTRLSLIRSWIRLARWARTQAGERVVVVGVWAAVPWLLVAPRSVVSTVWEHSLVREKVETAPKLRALSRLAKFLYRRAEAIVAVGPTHGEDVKALVPSARVRVIPNLYTPVDREVPAADPRVPWTESSAVILCLGSLTKTKNQIQVIHALSLLPRGYQARFLGDGPDLGRLRREAARLGLSERVSFLGYQSREVVEEHLREASVVVHPSQGETFGLVYYEAADAGVPLLAAKNRVALQTVPQLAPGRIYDGTVSDLVCQLRSPFQIPENVRQQATELRRKATSEESVLKKWMQVLREGERVESSD